MSGAPKEVVEALSTSTFSNSATAGNLHSLYYCWDDISDFVRGIYIASAKAAATELLAAIEKAEAAMATAEAEQLEAAE